MWSVIKFHKNKENILKLDLIKKFGKEVKFYSPKILIQRKKKNLFQKIEKNILGDYIFCFHQKFDEKNYAEIIKFTKGLKEILQNCNFSQNEIKEFIEFCKKNENKNGYLKSTFFELIEDKEYKLMSGPFSDKVFTILEKNKNRINILLGNIKTSIDKKNFLYSPII